MGHSLYETQRVVATIIPFLVSKFNIVTDLKHSWQFFVDVGPVQESEMGFCDHRLEREFTEIGKSWQAE
jgi:hypothetical protein